MNGRGDRRAADHRAAGEAFAGALAAVVEQLAANGSAVWHELPGGGRLHCDQALPFLAVHRPTGRPGDAAVGSIVATLGSHLIAPGDAAYSGDVAGLVRALVRCLADRFHACLLMEVWLEPQPTAAPRFRVLAEAPSDGAPLPSTAGTLRDALAAAAWGGQPIEVGVTIERRETLAPPDLPPLLAADEARRIGCLVLGLVVPPLHVGPGGALYPAMVGVLRRQASRALQRAFFDFIHVQTTHRPAHYQALGRRVVDAAVWQADRRLVELSESFGFLLAVTPVNVADAWRQFEAARYYRPPVFHQRLLALDPDVVKRELYALPLEDIEDPVLAYLLREKRLELDRQATLLEERDTPRFLSGSLQLFGGVEDRLLALAEALLEGLPPRAAGQGNGTLGAAAFASLASREIARYRSTDADFTARVRICTDVAALVVDGGVLHVNAGLRIAEQRARAVLAHEVGTHLLTYYNGRAQRLRLLSVGLAEYDGLQEGLALLAEYFQDGLTADRLRTVAARVVAIRHMMDGADFVEVFDELTERHAFGRRAAFHIAMRVFRCGGLTKDAVYLRGIIAVLDHLRAGGPLDLLWLGKAGLHHLPLLAELRHRGVLHPPRQLPRFVGTPEGERKLRLLRTGLAVTDLVAPSPR